MRVKVNKKKGLEVCDNTIYIQHWYPVVRRKRRWIKRRRKMGHRPVLQCIPIPQIPENRYPTPCGRDWCCLQSPTDTHPHLFPHAWRRGENYTIQCPIACIYSSISKMWRFDLKYNIIDKPFELYEEENPGFLEIPFIWISQVHQIATMRKNVLRFIDSCFQAVFVEEFNFFWLKYRFLLYPCPSICMN